VEDLDAIKTNPKVLAIYGRHVSLKKDSNGRYVGLCPFHSEKSASFNVFPDMRFHCFGCSSAGNVMQFVEKIQNCDFNTAVKIVKDEIGVESSWDQTRQKVDSVFKPVADANKVYKTIPLESWSKMETALANSKDAVHFLDSRGITLATAQQLRLGFAQNIGSLAGQDGADIADKGWIAFPSIEGDKVVSCKYRSTIRKKPGGFARQPGMATAMWNTETVDVFEPVYLTEGEFDACVLEQAGFRAVSVPSAGTKLTPAMKDMLMKASFVVLAGDSDTTGAEYMRKLWRELSERTYVLAWPESMKDANQTFLENCGRDLDKFKSLVLELTSKAKSVPMPDVYSLQEVMQNGEDTSLSERPDRLRFPWTEVDKMAILLPGSVMGMMATNTGQGKTAWTLQVSLFGARKHNETVVNWQCELSPSEISVMVAAQILRKNRNFITKDDLKVAAKQLEGVQYYVGNNPSINNIMDVLDLMEAAIKRLGATIAVLDTLHHYTTGIDDEVRVQAAAMKRIKQIATETGTKWIVVFHPRKANSQSKGKRVHISDVKGAASAGEASDAVAAIHRELSKHTEDEGGANDVYEEKTLVEFLKTRSKGIGKSSAFLHFFGEFASFESIENNYPEPEGDSNENDVSF